MRSRAVLPGVLGGKYRSGGHSLRFVIRDVEHEKLNSAVGLNSKHSKQLGKLYKNSTGGFPGGGRSG